MFLIEKVVGILANVGGAIVVVSGSEFDLGYGFGVLCPLLQLFFRAQMSFNKNIFG